MTTYWPHLTSFWISNCYLVGTLFVIRKSGLSGFDHVSGESPGQTCFLSPCLGSWRLSCSAKSCLPVCAGGATAAYYQPRFPAALAWVESPTALQVVSPAA